MLTPDLAILDDVLRVQLVSRTTRSGMIVSGRSQKALLLAIWATEGSPVDLPALALASGLEREHSCYAAQALIATGLVTRTRAPNLDGRGGGAPRVYAILRGRLAACRGEWPRGRWARPGLEGFGAPPADLWARAVRVRDEEARAAGLAVEALGRAVCGPIARCRERIAQRLVEEGLRAFMSAKMVGRLLGISQKPASRLVRKVERELGKKVAA